LFLGRGVLFSGGLLFLGRGVLLLGGPFYSRAVRYVCRSFFLKAGRFVLGRGIWFQGGAFGCRGVLLPNAPLAVHKVPAAVVRLSCVGGTPQGAGRADTGMVGTQGVLWGRTKTGRRGEDYSTRGATPCSRALWLYGLEGSTNTGSGLEQYTTSLHVEYAER